MKIVGIETHLLTYEYDEQEIWGWAGGKTLRRNAVFVQVKTDAGLSGTGEIGESAFLPRSVQRIVEEQFEPMLLGQDPDDIERLWHKMYMRSSHWGRKAPIVNIISGIDTALWDLFAKRAEKPLYRVLGGACRDSIRVYASGGQERPTVDMVDEVEQYRDQGYTAVKIRIGTDINKDLSIIRGIRERVGNDIDLMVDASQSYADNPWADAEALRVARKLREFDIYWLEEPLHEDDIEGYRRLWQHSPIPISAGENEYTRFGFKELISPRGVDIIQPDVTRSGGISECKKIAALASAYQIPCAPHTFGNGVGLMANIHFIASTANCVILEYDTTVNPLRDRLLLEPIKFDNGYVKLPESPGLGIRDVQEIVEQFPFKEEGLTVDRDQQQRTRQLTWLDI